MTTSIHCYDTEGKHIDLCADGSIEIYVGLPEPIKIDYVQAERLKAMIVAQAELSKKK